MLRARRLAIALVLLVAFALLWRPVVRPLGQGALLLADLYGPSLVGRDITLAPAPRESETTETLAGVAMRVSWWRPAWGERHPAILFVNGASPAGNDNAASRAFARALARAGYLVMLPEFPFLVAGRFDPASSAQIAAAFDALHGSRETTGETVGAFGASVGGGLLLAAAGREPALAGTAYLVVLGAYFDMRTYAESVELGTQRIDGRVVPWAPSAEVRERLPPAVRAASPEALELVSPRAVWARIRPPIFWLHDPDDPYEPVAEAYAARAAPRDGALSLAVPRLLQHAEVSPDAAARGPLFVVSELLGLLGFTVNVLRVAG